MAFDYTAFKDLLDEGGIRYRTNDKSLITTCPKCGKKEKLSFFKDSGRFVCYYCKEIENFEGKPEYALKELLGIAISDIRSRIYGITDISKVEDFATDFSSNEFQPDSEWDEEQLQIEQLPEIEMLAGVVQLTSELGKPGADYLVTRGIPIDVAVRYKMVYHPGTQRVIFPVFQNGVLVGYQGRLIVPTERISTNGEIIKLPKALTSKGYRKDSWLFNADSITSDWAILCEGPIDAIKCDLAGGAVAGFGKAISDTHMKILEAKGVKRIYLGLDPDAFDEAQRLMSSYGQFQFFDLRAPKPFKDLGEMTFEQVKQLFDNAKEMPIFDFVTTFGENNG